MRYSRLPALLSPFLLLLFLSLTHASPLTSPSTDDITLQSSCVCAVGVSGFFCGDRGAWTSGPWLQGYVYQRSRLYWCDGDESDRVAEPTRYCENGCGESAVEGEDWCR
jgi:hypothetical protein